MSWREEQELCAEAKRRRLAQDREEENRCREEAAQATQSVFRVDFDKHKGFFGRKRSMAKISRIFGLPSDAHVPQARLHLQQALKDTGCCLVANAGPVCRAAAERVLDRSSPPDVPIEVQQLQLMYGIRSPGGGREPRSSPTNINEMRPKGGVLPELGCSYDIAPYATPTVTEHPPAPSALHPVSRCCLMPKTLLCPRTDARSN